MDALACEVAGPGRRLSLAGPRPEAATIPVNRGLRDHGNGLGRGARGGGGGGDGGGSLVAGRDGGAAAAAVAVAPAPALSVMRRSSPEKKPEAEWEADAAAAAAATAAATESLPAETEKQQGVDAGAAGDPERLELEEQPKDVGRIPTPTRRHAPEEGEARVVRRLPPALPLAQPRPAARALSQLVKARGRSRSRVYRRSAGSMRPVTVDSSKARTSLDALKISLRQLRWKEVRPAGPARGHRGVVPRPGPRSHFPGQVSPSLLCSPTAFLMSAALASSSCRSWFIRPVFSSVGPGARGHLSLSAFQ